MGDYKALDPRKTISDVFEGDIIIPGCTHIIIKTPEPVGETHFVLFSATIQCLMLTSSSCHYRVITQH